MARALEQVNSNATIVMSDICTKALDAIRLNLTKNGNMKASTAERVELVAVEWGNNESDWAIEHAGSFDLIIASDVVYLPECVDPLIHSVKHFLKPNTGKCLLVNCMVRTEAFLPQIEG